MQDFGNAVASVSGQQQLHWLHILHTSVDDVLRGLSATKVDSSGERAWCLSLCSMRPIWRQQMAFKGVLAMLCASCRNEMERSQEAMCVHAVNLLAVQDLKLEPLKSIYILCVQETH